MKGKFGIIAVILHKKQGRGEEVWTVDYCSLLTETSASTLVLLWSSQHSKQILLTRGRFPPSYLSGFPPHSEKKSGIPYSEQRSCVTVLFLPWPGCLSPLTEFLPQWPTHRQGWPQGLCTGLVWRFFSQICPYPTLSTLLKPSLTFALRILPPPNGHFYLPSLLCFSHGTYHTV